MNRPGHKHLYNAYILSKEGNSEADRYFSLEIETYPESERFITFIRSQLKN